MFDGLPILILVGLFAGAAAAVWFAGVRLSDATDVLSDSLGFGEALGGLILLAIATNLPEIAITASASLAGNIDVAVGNILGGIAIQTVVLVVMDAFSGRSSRSISGRATSLVPVLEGLLVIAVLLVAITAAQLPESLTMARIDPGAAAIALLWGVGIFLLSRARSGIPWTCPPIDADRNRPDGKTKTATSNGNHDPKPEKGRTGRSAAIVFGVAAVVTLVGGFILEQTGTLIAGEIGMSGVLFAATVLAAATALPEVSTGIESIRVGDDTLAISDIFGGNAFLPVLFLLASLLSGSAVLPTASTSDLYLAGLGALLTAVYCTGLIFRSSRRIGRLGIDSVVVLLLYAVGLVGLVAIVRAG